MGVHAKVEFGHGMTRIAKPLRQVSSAWANLEYIRILLADIGKYPFGLSFRRVGRTLSVKTAEIAIGFGESLI